MCHLFTYCPWSLSPPFYLCSVQLVVSSHFPDPLARWIEPMRGTGRNWEGQGKEKGLLSSFSSCAQCDSSRGWMHQWSPAPFHSLSTQHALPPQKCSVCCLCPSPQSYHQSPRILSRGLSTSHVVPLHPHGDPSQERSKRQLCGVLSGSSEVLVAQFPPFSSAPGVVAIC